MNMPLDKLIDTIEQRKHQLDDVLESYRQFKAKLDALPPEFANNVKDALTENTHDKAISEQMTPAPQGTDLVGKPALECATIILIEHKNEPTHFVTIAKEAIKRGYKGRRPGSPDEVESRIAKSFWAAMSRSDDFESVGKGCYRLRRWPQ